MVTRMYLKVTSDKRATLTSNRSDPYAVFKMHPVQEVSWNRWRFKVCQTYHGVRNIHLINIMTSMVSVSTNLAYFSMRFILELICSARSTDQLKNRYM